MFIFFTLVKYLVKLCLFSHCIFMLLTVRLTTSDGE